MLLFYCFPGTLTFALLTQWSTSWARETTVTFTVKWRSTGHSGPQSTLLSPSPGFLVFVFSCVFLESSNDVCVFFHCEKMPDFVYSWHSRFMMSWVSAERIRATGVPQASVWGANITRRYLSTADQRDWWPSESQTCGTPCIAPTWDLSICQQLQSFFRVGIDASCCVFVSQSASLFISHNCQL